MHGKVYSSREFEKILKANDYEYVSTCGSHLKYKNKYNKNTIILKCNKLNPCIVQRLVKENNLKI